MRGHLLLTNCIEDEVTRPNIELALKENRLLWLDLQDTGDETLTLLREVFKIHPLAVEDAREFHQRPKIEDYDDFVSLVVYGARGLDEPLTEVHCFYAEHFLVSVHRDEVPAIDDACHTLGRLPTGRRLVALYRPLDALVDTMFPYLAAMDDRIDDLQDQIFENPKEEQLAAVFALKRQVVGTRKMVTPQRDMVASMLAGVVPIPGMTAESERYVRDLYDHLIRISDMVDSLRDLLSGSLDAYMSMVSNRLNDVMKQLTIIATVFLPLSFLTGFFGQNFAWLVVRLGPWARSSAWVSAPRSWPSPPCSRCSAAAAGWGGAKNPRPERAVVPAPPPAVPPWRAGTARTDSLSCEAWCLRRKRWFS